jgi:hypothetical protein
MDPSLSSDRPVGLRMILRRSIAFLNRINLSILVSQFLPAFASGCKKSASSWPSAVRTTSYHHISGSRMNRTIHLAACAFLLLLVLCFCSAAYRLEAHYTLAVGNRVGLTLGRYDATQLLIIDPVLVYSTYIGGSGLDAGNGIAVDSDGNA